MAAPTPGTGITSTVSVLTASTPLVASNTLRRGIILYNPNTTTPIYYGFGTGNVVTTGMYVLATSSQVAFGPQEPSLEGKISIPSALPTGDLAAIATATGVTAVITEW